MTNVDVQSVAKRPWMRQNLCVNRAIGRRTGSWMHGRLASEVYHGSIMSPSLKKRLPNLVTVARLGLAVLFLAILATYQYPEASPARLIWATIVFVIAISTDALDGYLARRWSAVSVFGRVMDPLCDKILVLGSLIMLAGPNFATVQAVGGGERLVSVSGIAPWMVVVVLWRELLVTGLRSLAESRGLDFSAGVSGKLKMIVQSAVVPIVMLLIALADPVEQRWSLLVRDGLVWLMVIVTVLSAVPYLMRARTVLRSAAIPGEPGERK